MRFLRFSCFSRYKYYMSGSTAVISSGTSNSSAVSASVSVQFISFQRMSLKRFTGMGFYIKNNHNKNWG